VLLWSIGPLFLAGFILRIAAPSSQEVEAPIPMSPAVFWVLAWILGIGILILLILVLNSPDRLVN
jgi:hypothetical protein